MLATFIELEPATLHTPLKVNLSHMAAQALHGYECYNEAGRQCQGNG
jgi:hypothetical protein